MCEAVGSLCRRCHAHAALLYGVGKLWDSVLKNVTGVVYELSRHPERLPGVVAGLALRQLWHSFHTCPRLIPLASLLPFLRRRVVHRTSTRRTHGTLRWSELSPVDVAIHEIMIPRGDAQGETRCRSCTAICPLLLYKRSHFWREETDMFRYWCTWLVGVAIWLPPFAYAQAPDKPKLLTDEGLMRLGTPVPTTQKRGARNDAGDSAPHPAGTLAASRPSIYDDIDEYLGIKRTARQRQGLVLTQAELDALPEAPTTQPGQGSRPSLDEIAAQVFGVGTTTTRPSIDDAAAEYLGTKRPSIADIADEVDRQFEALRKVPATRPTAAEVFDAVDRELATKRLDALGKVPAARPGKVQPKDPPHYAWIVFGVLLGVVVISLMAVAAVTRITGYIRRSPHMVRSALAIVLFGMAVGMVVFPPWTQTIERRVGTTKDSSYRSAGYHPVFLAPSPDSWEWSVPAGGSSSQRYRVVGFQIDVTRLCVQECAVILTTCGLLYLVRGKQRPAHGDA